MALPTQNVYVGIPASVVDLHQKDLLERAYHDALVPAFTYRALAKPEEWPAHMGTVMYQTRAGLIPPITTPLPAGADPQPQQVPFEQWGVVIQRYAASIDTHIPTSATANADLFLRNIQQIGIQAAQSANRIARNFLFQAYLSGQTVLVVATASTDTQIQVAAINGFTDSVNPQINAQPQQASPAYPVPITIWNGATAIPANVVGFVPSNPADLNGPGYLQLDRTVGAIVAVRSAVISKFAPTIVRSASGKSVDAIGPNDTITLQQCINATAQLRRQNVMPHSETNFYHAQISPIAVAQMFSDPVYQRLNQSLPDGYAYRNGFMGEVAGIAFFQNNESPELLTVGSTVATGANSLYAPDIGAEVVNAAGVQIGRMIVTGRDCMYEKWLNEDAYVTEAGINGKVGDFQIINNGIQISTERTRLILRAPQNRLQDQVAASWSFTTSFPIPSDQTAPGGNQRYRRAVVLEYATG